MGIGTGSSDPTQFSMYYTNNQGTVNLTNRTMKGLAPNSPISTIFTNLPLGTDSIGTYRQMWVDYVQSGLLVFGFTTNAYTDTSSNPNSTQAGDNPGDWGGVIWNQAELSYTGSIYDNIDVTAINQVGIPMLLQFMTNTTTPAPVANGTKGYTNTNNIPTMLRLLNSTPGAPWFFAAPLTNTANWLGPSTAAKPSLIMPPCQNTNYSNTVIWQAGWPGAVTPTFAPYVKAVFSNVPALGTNNGTKVFARIEDTISLANTNRTTNQNSGATEYRYRFDFTLLPNPRATNLYSTPIPVLTNGQVIVVDTGTIPPHHQHQYRPLDPLHGGQGQSHQQLVQLLLLSGAVELPQRCHASAATESALGLCHLVEQLDESRHELQLQLVLFCRQCL